MQIVRALQLISDVLATKDAYRDQIGEEFIAFTVPWEKRMRAKLNELFSIQEQYVQFRVSQIFSALRRFQNKTHIVYRVDDEKTYRDALRRFYDGSINKDLVDFFTNKPAWDREMFDEMTKYTDAVLKQRGQGVLDELRLGMSFDMEYPGARQFLEVHYITLSKNVWGWVNSETEKQLRGVIEAAITQGLSVIQLSELVAGVFNEARSYRSERIARTEVIRASNMGAEAGYLQSGIVEYKEWLTTKDERTCPFCRPMNGKRQLVGTTYFAVGDIVTGEDGSQFTNTYSNIFSAPLHPNCRCTIIPVVDLADIRAGDVNPNLSLDQQVRALVDSVGAMEYPKRYETLVAGVKQLLANGAKPEHFRLASKAMLAQFDTSVKYIKSNFAQSIPLVKRGALLKKYRQVLSTIGSYADDAVLQKLTNGQLKEMAIYSSQIRESYTKGGGVPLINLWQGSTPATVAHEYGHQIESVLNKQGVNRRWLELMSTQSSKFNKVIYGPEIDGCMVIKDKFIHAYTGKLYRHGDTEALSMGLQQFASETTLISFMEKHPEHFTQIFGLLSGVL